MARYVIVGNSAAGLAAAEAIRERDTSGCITVVSKEGGPAYSRVALPYLLSGEKRLPEAILRDEAWCEEKGAEPVGGTVTELVAACQTVRLDNGREIGYDRLLIATGSTPVVPAVPGLRDADALYHWTLDDARRIEEQAAKSQSCLVIGAGFIGLLTTNALMKRFGLKFTVVEASEQVMPNLLDAEAGNILARRIREMGISLLLEDRVEAIERWGQRYVATLTSGLNTEADMIVCGAGVRPNIDFLAASGLAIERGILTNERQETNLPHVYAAGDCAEGFDLVTGERAVHAIWPTAIDQGRTAGANMAGDNIRYEGSLSWNVSELFGLTLASVGKFRSTEGTEQSVFRNPSGSAYRKLLMENDRIVGAVAVGRPEHMIELGVAGAMIRRGTDISRWKHMLTRERISYAMMAYESARR